MVQPETVTLVTGKVGRPEKCKKNNLVFTEVENEKGILLLHLRN